MSPRGALVGFSVRGTHIDLTHAWRPYVYTRASSVYDRTTTARFPSQQRTLWKCARKRNGIVLLHVLALFACAFPTTPATLSLRWEKKKKENRMKGEG